MPSAAPDMSGLMRPDLYPSLSLCEESQPLPLDSQETPSLENAHSTSEEEEEEAEEEQRQSFFEEAWKQELVKVRHLEKQEQKQEQKQDQKQGHLYGQK